MSIEQLEQELLKEIRDELRLTNSKIDALEAWIRAEIEKEQKRSDLQIQAIEDSQKTFPKRDIWGIFLLGLLFLALYFSQELFS